MSMRAAGAVLMIGIAALAYYAWSRNTAHVSTPVPPASGEVGDPDGRSAGDGGGTSGGSGLVVQSGGDPGVAWSVPKRWKSEAGSAMRLATYAVPAAAGDAEGGRCAVYYFGPGQGGGTDDNIERWIGEFERPGHPGRWSKTVGGLKVTRVRVRGTYVPHAGMAGGPEGTRENHELAGAIVEGPNGSVFFKLTGPAKTVDLAFREFEAMLASVKRK